LRITYQDHFFIHNHDLDIHATGSTIEDAKMDFASEFDASYNWFQDTPDDRLSGRLLRAKQMMIYYVQKILDEGSSSDGTQDLNDKPGDLK
jgi:hypothetical protein